MENWYIKNRVENINILKEIDTISNFQRMLLANRDIVDSYKIETITNPSLDMMHDSTKMKDMDKGINILLESMKNNENIRIVGDYDQDGVAATVILYKGIRHFYKNISYAIPDRIEDGYGLNKNIVDECLEDEVSLIITCDNGIAAFEAIEYAKENGIVVIVTDHHEVVQRDGKDFLPLADAVINPHRSDDEYPFAGICGALVTYKFIDALYSIHGKFLGLNKKDIYPLLQYAALGTVCDMMQLIDENRIVVIEGLKILNSIPNQGIRALLKEVNWQKDVTIYTIGFLIGPIINASGRIYTAKLGVELFLEEDYSLVMEYAKTLVELNNERKDMTQASLESAIEHIEYEKFYLNDIIVLYDNSIHESICGLVAGRIKDIYNRPTLVLTDSQDPEIIKGSGRSIKAYDIFFNLDKYRTNFVAFGGHKMACGLSFKKEKLDDFRRFVNENSPLEEKDFRKEIEIDYPLSFKQISNDLVNEISKLEPFGYGFSEPIFASKNVLVTSAKVLGKDKNVLKLFLKQDDIILQAISFDIEDILGKIKDRHQIYNIEDIVNKNVDLVYKLTINTFNGISNIQLNIVSMR